MDNQQVTKDVNIEQKTTFDGGDGCETAVGVEKQQPG